MSQPSYFLSGSVSLQLKQKNNLLRQIKTIFLNSLTMIFLDTII